MACFSASQRVQRLRHELTLAQIREKIPNGWTDRHQIWHTCADSYGNGYTPNKFTFETQGGIWEVFKTLGKLSTWHQLWFTSADSSGSGLSTSRPSITQGTWGGVRGHKFKVLGSFQTDGPIGTTFGTRLRIRLGMDIDQIQFAPQYPGGIWRVRGSQIQNSGEAIKLAPTLVHVCGFIWEWT